MAYEEPSSQDDYIIPSGRPGSENVYYDRCIRISIRSNDPPQNKKHPRRPPRGREYRHSGLLDIVPIRFVEVPDFRSPNQENRVYVPVLAYVPKKQPSKPKKRF